jgi:hypothetical protein
LCSFSFSGRLTGHPRKNKKEKKEKPGRSSGPGEEAAARDGTVSGVELDAEEPPSGELGCEQREARAAERHPGVFRSGSGESRRNLFFFVCAEVSLKFDGDEHNS